MRGYLLRWDLWIGILLGALIAWTILRPLVLSDTPVEPIKLPLPPREFLV